MLKFLAGRLVYQLLFIGIMTSILVYQCDYKLGQFSDNYKQARSSIGSSIIIATVPIIAFLPDNKFCDRK